MTSVHQAQRDCEQQEPDGAAPVSDRLEQKHLMRERDRGPDRERQRRQTDQQPAHTTHEVPRAAIIARGFGAIIFCMKRAAIAIVVFKNFKTINTAKLTNLKG